MVNLTSAATWRAPLEELIPVGPVEVSLPGVSAKQARLLVRGGTAPVRLQNGAASVTIPSISDHEVVVLE